MCRRYKINIFCLVFYRKDKYNLIAESSDKRDKKLRAEQQKEMTRHFSKLDGVRSAESDQAHT